MLKKFLIGAALVASMLGASAAPSSADTTSTASNTLTTQAQVNAVAKKMAVEHKWLSYACAFQSGVKTVLADASAGKVVPVKVAVQVMKVVNKAGDGSCAAANVVAGTIADMQVTFSRYHHVYIKQDQFTPSAWKVLSKIKVTRYVGSTSSSTDTWYYSVGVL